MFTLTKFLNPFQTNKIKLDNKVKLFVRFWWKTRRGNRFILSNFNHYQLVWVVSSVKCLNKIENIQKRALMPSEKDHINSIDKLCEKLCKSTVNVGSYRTFHLEVIKKLYDLIPIFMRKIFHFWLKNKLTRDRKKLNLEIPKIRLIWRKSFKTFYF